MKEAVSEMLLIPRTNCVRGIVLLPLHRRLCRGDIRAGVLSLLCYYRCLSGEGDGGNVPFTELDLCLRESAANLRLNGVVCAIGMNADGKTGGDVSGTLYDFFQTAVEMSFDSLTAITAIVSAEGQDCKMTLILNCEADMNTLVQAFDNSSAVYDDGVWYCEIRMTEGMI